MRLKTQNFWMWRISRNCEKFQKSLQHPFFVEFCCWYNHNIQLKKNLHRLHFFFFFILTFCFRSHFMTGKVRLHNVFSRQTSNWVCLVRQLKKVICRNTSKRWNFLGQRIYRLISSQSKVIESFQRAVKCLYDSSLYYFLYFGIQSNIEW